ncbi:hypothetical protein [Streptomyces sp. S063]|nr:hypothetical protein [Streptomyces sp. S063]
MALQTSMSIGELKKRNEASKAARAAERSGSAPTGQQQKGR